MTTTEIEYTYLDESRTECTGVYAGDRDAAIAAAVDFIDAERHGEAYHYLGDHVGNVYAASADEMAELGAGLIEQPRGDVYSLWCTRAGTIVP